jgi:Sap, sulfolipid-1-addressing protein
VTGLTLEIAGLGLLAAFTSPGSVVAVIALLSMSRGKRRALAFIVGWTIAIGVIAVLMVFVLHGQNFHSRQTTPSRAASIAEIALGCLLVAVAARTHRQPHQPPKSQSPPTWLDRLDRSHWSLAVAVGAFMMSYTLTLAAAAEILKANVDTLDATLVGLVFTVTSMLTIAAPVVIVLAAPDTGNRILADSKEWVLAHSRSILLAMLTLAGLLLIARGAYDLIR